MKRPMKKLLFFVACFLMTLSCTNKTENKLTVRFSNIESDSITFILLDKSLDKNEKTETLAVNDGSVDYCIDGDKARYVLISYASDEGMARMLTYVVPGEKGILSGTSGEPQWEGEGFYDEMGKAHKELSPFVKELKDIVADFNQKAETAGMNVDSLRSVTMEKYEELNNKIEETRLTYIKANPKSEVALIYCLEAEDMESAYALIDDGVKKGRFSLFAEAIENQIAVNKAKAEAAKNVAPGCEAPDFTLKDLNGNDLALSSLRGKYVVLDFWGSWCSWCIKGIPKMKEYYNKYAGKFEILGIDCNDTEDKWQDAVKKYELSWKHVYNPCENNQVVTDYAIEGYPTKIIIDPQGKIVKTVVGEDPEFYTFLDELFK